MRKAVVILFHGLAGWALCGAIMGVGMNVTSMHVTLIAHAIGAPVIFIAISWFYHTRFGYTSPLATAGIFLGIIIFMDVFLVAMLINKSFEMFYSPLGTWIPFALIFTATWLAGRAAALPRPGPNAN